MTKQIIGQDQQPFFQGVDLPEHTTRLKCHGRDFSKQQVQQQQQQHADGRMVVLIMCLGLGECSDRRSTASMPVRSIAVCTKELVLLSCFQIPMLCLLPPLIYIKVSISMYDWIKLHWNHWTISRHKSAISSVYMPNYKQKYFFSLTLFYNQTECTYTKSTHYI